MDFGKVLTAMVTPFTNDLEIDLQATELLVEHLISTGTDTLVVAGTTGEGPTLSSKEKIILFEHVKKITNNRVKVIANAGSNDTLASVAFVKEIENKRCADGIMLVNPYYNKPNQKGLYAHFEKIASSTNLPIMLYNIPGRTSVNLNAETTISLSKIPNIVAIKESSGDLSQVSRVIEGTDNSFSVYSGDDNLTLPICSIGGKGVVSVASHLYGKEIKEMIENKDALLHRKLLDFCEGIFFTTNPVPIKNALKHIGLNVGEVRLPLIGLTPTEEIIVRELVATTNKKFNN